MCVCVCLWFLDFIILCKEVTQLLPAYASTLLSHFCVVFVITFVVVALPQLILASFHSSNCIVLVSLWFHISCYCCLFLLFAAAAAWATARIQMFWFLYFDSESGPRHIKFLATSAAARLLFTMPFLTLLTFWKVWRQSFSLQQQLLTTISELGVESSRLAPLAPLALPLH